MLITGDICSHESFCPQHLHLNNAHILQVGEGPQQSLQRPEPHLHKESGRKDLGGLYPTHISIQNLPPLLRVVQRRDGQVSDGDVSRGRERDQQHHEPSGLLQRQLQVMSVLPSQGGEIQLAAVATQTLSHYNQSKQRCSAAPLSVLNNQTLRGSLDQIT